jgi:hypothetical protein
MFMMLARLSDLFRVNEPSWSQLKFFKNRYLFRFMSAWILLAPLIEHVGEDLPKNVCVATYCIKLTLPFDIKISVLSTLALLGSYIIYQIYCPSLIKSFDDFRQFASSGGTANALIGFAKEFYYKKLLPRNHDEFRLRDIEFSYDNIFIQQKRPFFKRSLAFETIDAESGARSHVVSRGRMGGFKFHHPRYRPIEIAKASQVVSLRRSINMGRVNTAIDILFDNIDLYFEFMVEDGPDGDLALYMRQIGQLYILTWTRRDEAHGSTYVPNPEGVRLYRDVQKDPSWIGAGRLDLSDAIDDELLAGAIGPGFEKKHSFFFGYIEGDAARDKLEDAFDSLRMHFDRENERQLRWANLLLLAGLIGWLWCACKHLLPYLLR